jgi:hypothetical protein
MSSLISLEAMMASPTRPAMSDIYSRIFSGAQCSNGAFRHTTVIRAEFPFVSGL